MHPIWSQATAVLALASRASGLPQIVVPNIGVGVGTTAGAGVNPNVGVGIPSIGLPTSTKPAAVDSLSTKSTFSALPGFSPSFANYPPRTALSIASTVLVPPASNTAFTASASSTEVDFGATVAPSFSLMTSTPPVSFFDITLSTTVPLTDTAVLASLATIPANSGLSSFLSVLTSDLRIATSAANTILPALPSMTETASSMITTPSIADALESLGEEMISSMASALVQIMTLLAQQTAVAPQTSPSILAGYATSLLVVTGPVSVPTPLAMRSGAVSAATSDSLASSAPNTSPATTSSIRRNEHVERQLPNPLTLLVPRASSSSKTSATSASAPTPPAQPDLPLGNLPVIGTATFLPISAGSVVVALVTSIPIPANFTSIIQGVYTAAVADIDTAVSSLPLIGQAQQILAIFQLLAIVNFQALGSLATLTSLSEVQDAVKLLNEPDLATVVDFLCDGSIIESTAADGLISSVVSFVQSIEYLLPVVTDIKAVVSYIILEQLGLTGLQCVVDGSVVSAI